MYRLKSALSAVSLAAGVAVVVSIFVVSAGALPTRDGESASEAQYNGQGTISTDTEKGPGPGYYRFYDRWKEEDTPSADALSVRVPSQGSDPMSQAPARALSIMEPPTPYSQVVDNASPRHFFSARGEWKKSSNRLTRYGRNYRYVRPAEDVTPAWFKVRIPTDGFYTVYARWPSAEGNNPKTRFQISTASGVKKVNVNQRRDGGVWMRLGAYKMNAGNRYSVRVAGRSKSEGRVVADAVMVVAGTQAAPQAGNDGTSSDGGAPATYGPFSVGGETTMDAKAVVSEVIERARTHLGTPYVHSPPMPCTAYQSEDCSCFTSLVFSEWVTMPDNPVGQWYMGDSVEKSDLLPGDLVFFKEAGPNRPITHVGIYSGRGNILHASTYWGQVVESPMNGVDGYYGARRLT
ncbi:MAG TPA: NlpC/P60 family protein [Rubrobacter sp.]|nr:NlpC/P60 family protein [Rubrobacter sp.]